MKNLNIYINFSLLLIITSITISSFLISSSKGDEEAALFGSTYWNGTRAVVVRILIVVDTDVYLSSDIYNEIQNYYMSYWKVVNKYVSLLRDPSVRVEIIKIVDYYETEFGNHTNGVSLTGWVSTEFILQQLNKNLNNYTDLKNYDIAILFTRWRLCTTVITQKKNIKCDEFADAKLAFPDENKIYNGKPIKGLVGVVRDDGQTYQGIWDALFLIGSYLGAKTDGSKGAEMCNPQDSYIMAPKPIWNKFKFQWSNCSITSIRNNLKYRETIPIKDNFFKNISMPGELLSLDNYCRLTTRDVACYFHEENCKALICKLKDSGCKPNEIALPAPEGSWCGVDKRCSFGVCRHV